MNKIAFLKLFTLIVFLVFFGFTIYSFFSKTSTPQDPLPGSEEKFDSKLLVINTCEQLDSLVLEKFRKSNHDTAGTVLFIDHFLRYRFYHSYSELSFKDNWIAHVCGKILWWDFLVPVIPCDIIKSPMGACSQQGILFQHQLDLLKIRCSTINFFPVSFNKSGHYAVSVYYGNSWHFYDTNQEPLIVDSTMPSIESIVERELYKKMYVSKFNVRFQEFFKDKSYERVDKEPFSKGKMYYFQMITGVLSNWGWLFLLALYLWLVSKARKSPFHS